MKNTTRVVLVVGCIFLLSACAGLPEKVDGEAKASAGLALIHQDKSVRLYARPDFDPLRFGAFALDRVEVQTASSLDAEQKGEQELLGANLATQITTQLTTQNSASPLHVDILLHDIKPASPALNILTLALVFAPLDTGAMIVETTYRDSTGQIQARRIEQLTGSIFNIRASLSAYGQHKVMLSDWAQRCPRVASCLVASSEQ